MKKSTLLIILLLFAIFITSCGASNTSEVLSDITAEEKAVFNQTEGDTIQIANEETQYDIIIIEPGFNSWLSSFAKSEGYYSQSYLENRNYIMVTTWNRRVLQPQQFNPNLYEMQIDYQPGIDYGYDVNYKMFNYFIYFQRKYNQRLSSFLPRI